MQMSNVDKAIDKVKDWFSGESAAIRNDQTNFYNLLYTGPVYMGSNRERINVIWDTGSSVYLGETHLCTGCASPKYDFTAESGGSFNYLTGRYSESYLDGTSLEGFWATDSVCIADDPTTCASNFKWVAIDNASGLSADEDGVLGMS